jgi:tRNA(Leu) C34 or U34 (ribose-2'-O)-methylase TrmL
MKHPGKCAGLFRETKRRRKSCFVSVVSLPTCFNSGPTSENYQSVATSLRGNSIALHDADLVHLANNGPRAYRETLDFEIDASSSSSSSSTSTTQTSKGRESSSSNSDSSDNQPVRETVVSSVGDNPPSCSEDAPAEGCDRIALWFGHEGNGLSSTALHGSSLAIHVEMVGAGDSLGVAACVPLVLHEVLRQRRAARANDIWDDKMHTGIAASGVESNSNYPNKHNQNEINKFPPSSADEQAALWARLGNTVPSLPARTERRLAKRKALVHTAGRKDLARFKAAAAVAAAAEARQAWAARREALGGNAGAAT